MLKNCKPSLANFCTAYHFMLYVILMGKNQYFNEHFVKTDCRQGSQCLGFSKDFGVSALALGSWEVASKKDKILGFQRKSHTSNNFDSLFNYQKLSRSTKRFIMVIWKEIIVNCHKLAYRDSVYF